MCQQPLRTWPSFKLPDWIRKKPMQDSSGTTKTWVCKAQGIFLKITKLIFGTQVWQKNPSTLCNSNYKILSINNFSQRANILTFSFGQKDLMTESVLHPKHRSHTGQRFTTEQQPCMQAGWYCLQVTPTAWLYHCAAIFYVNMWSRSRMPSFILHKPKRWGLVKVILLINTRS